MPHVVGRSRVVFAGEQCAGAIKERLPAGYDEIVADIAEKAPCPVGWLDDQNDCLQSRRRWDTVDRKPSDFMVDFYVPLFTKALTLFVYCTPARGATPSRQSAAILSPCSELPDELQPLIHLVTLLPGHRNLRQARSTIGEFIETVYNRQRLHSALAYRSPDEYETALGRLSETPEVSITTNCY
jgi:hypothetical protein